MRPKSSPPPDSVDRGPSEPSYFIGETEMRARRAAPGLHIVATPIGNLGDISLRALETLAGVDMIACEDTRITARLLHRYGIRTKMTPYHEHNAAARRPVILARLAAGGAIALVSDAGTPLISDPGYKLAREAADAGHDIHAVPGASSVLTALAVAALPTDRFYFEGFLPPKERARRARIAALADIDTTLVLFETGPRIAATLRDLADRLGARNAAVCRELTKLHEEVSRDLLPQLADRAATMETRGEFVIVIAPPLPSSTANTDDVDRLLETELQSHSVKEAVALVTAATGRSRGDVYARALVLKKAHEEKGAR
jgi:16S rRNA (cytidine1402-2'-O)-methyltransferase